MKTHPDFRTSCRERSHSSRTTRVVVLLTLLLNSVAVSYSAPPVINEPPQDALAKSGRIAVFAVQADGEDPLSFQWTHNGVRLTDDARIFGANGSRLVICPVGIGDEGEYAVTVTSGGERIVSGPASLRLDLPLPQITAKPSSRTVSPGAATAFAVSATGMDPVRYQWQKQDQPLSDDGRITGTTAATLEIANVTWEDAGWYSVLIETPGGGVLSEPALLTVSADSPVASAVDLTGLEWRAGGDAAWLPESSETHDGTDALRSGEIEHNQNSRLETTLVGPGRLSFWWRVSSENADALRLEFDGATLYWISGEVEWEQRTIEVRWGTHTVAWVYAKDGSVNSRSDTAWVDQISYEPYPLTSIGEALEGVPMPVELDGPSLWFGQREVSHDGTDSAQSGNIGHGQDASIRTEVTGPGRIQFWSRTSSEGADPLLFLVDDATRMNRGGDSDWEEFSMDLPWGIHSLAWLFGKDGSVNSYSDAVWLDQVSYVEAPLVRFDEAVDRTDLAWVSGGANPWFGQRQMTHDGADSAQSPPLGNGQSAYFQTDVEGPGEIRFYWSVSSEGADPLQFRIDDALKNSISGIVDWQLQRYALPPGGHRLHWQYEKDGSVASNADAGWVDEVGYIPAPPLPVALDAPQLTWTTDGDGAWYPETVTNLDGQHAVRAGVIKENQSSALRTTVEGPGTFRFHWRAECEGADPCRFLLDDTVLFSIAGTTDWELKTAELDPGTHTLTWQYTKDGSISIGADTVWVDQVSFLPEGGVATANDGDWMAVRIALENTPEAELMVRTGDIDNLGFGWPAGFDPFSGNSTPSHAFPWAVDPMDPPGTDRIMVVSSYNGIPPAGSDGYTSSTQRPGNDVEPIVLEYDLGTRAVRSAILQMFLDDFQAPVWRATYQVLLDGHPVPFIEDIINQLSQTGPIGKLVSVQIPAASLALLDDGRLEIRFDDPVTGAGDGFAVDFVKLLINPSSVGATGTVTGIVINAATQAPISGALVSAGGIVEGLTDLEGHYTLLGVPAGLVAVEASKVDFESVRIVRDLIAGQSINVDFALTIIPRVRIFQEHIGLIRIEWPAAAAGMTLQSCSSLSLAEWLDDPEVPQIENEHSFILVPGSDTTRFFRLRGN